MAKRMRLPVYLRLVGLVIALLAALAVPAHALDAKKSAMALAQQAAKAFEAGDMQRAAQAYLEAWHTDSAEPNYLYGAARAEQSAGQHERAEEHYRQFVAMPKVDAARVAKARGYLTELEGLRADDKVDTADRSAKRGEWSLAAAAYGDAWKLRPDRLNLLMKAARAAREGGDKAQAKAWLQEYLTRAPADAADRGEAKAMLQGLGAPVPEPPPVAKQQPKPLVTPPTGPAPLTTQPIAVTQPAEPDAPVSHGSRRTAGWWTVGAGAALAVTGAVLLVLGKGAETQFNNDLGYDGTVVHGDLTYEQASSRAQWIGGLQTTGVTFLSVGVAAAGVGTALLLTSPSSHVTLVPDLHGVSMAGRF